MAVVLVIILVTSAGGCWDLRIIEDLALVFGIGVDVDELDPQLLMVTISTPVFAPGGQDTMQTSAQGYSLVQAIMNLQHQRDREIVLGSLSVIVFSEEAALNGTMHRAMVELDQIRDVNVNTWMAVLKDGPAQHLFQLVPADQPLVSVHAMDLLNRNHLNGLTPRVTASSYWVRFNTKGVNPVVPVLEMAGSEEDKTHLMHVGSAAVNGEGKMAGLLTEGESIIYMLLTETTMRGQFHTHVNYDEQRQRLVTGLVKKVRRSVKTQIADGRPVIDIKMRLDVDIVDTDLVVDNVMDEAVFRKLEGLLARDFQGNMLRVLKKSQEWETDIVGLGQFVRVQHPKWFRDKDWASEYGRSEINVEVKVEIMRIGTLVCPRY